MLQACCQAALPPCLPETLDLRPLHDTLLQATGKMHNDEEAVKLYVYDLTQGMAKAFSPMFLGKQIEGVWHTGVVVGGTEYFFGYGVQRAIPGTTPFGQPLQVIELGRTQIPHDLREAMLQDLSQRFRPEDYNLLFNNCNNFSHEFSLLLTGNGIPESILAQAQEVLNTPMGQMLMPMMLQMEGQLGGMTANGVSPSPPSFASQAPTQTSAAVSLQPATQPSNPPASVHAANPSSLTNATTDNPSGMHSSSATTQQPSAHQSTDGTDNPAQNNLTHPS